MAYICTAKVRDELKTLLATSATVPAVKIKAADSPTIRPIAKIIPQKIPGMALGRTILKIVRSLPAPSAKAPSR